MEQSRRENAGSRLDNYTASSYRNVIIFLVGATIHHRINRCSLAYTMFSVAIQIIADIEPPDVEFPLFDVLFFANFS